MLLCGFLRNVFFFFYQSTNITAFMFINNSSLLLRITQHIFIPIYIIVAHDRNFTVFFSSYDFYFCYSIQIIQYFWCFCWFVYIILLLQKSTSLKFIFQMHCSFNIFIIHIFFYPVCLNKLIFLKLICCLFFIFFLEFNS